MSETQLRIKVAHLEKQVAEMQLILVALANKLHELKPDEQSEQSEG